MASVKQGQYVSFTHKHKPYSGTVKRVWSRGRFVGVNITDDEGKEHTGVSLHDIEPCAQPSGNPAHGGNGKRQSYYLSLDSFAIYAYDAQTDKELAAVSYIEPDIEKAIDSIKNQLSKARLVGARFVM